MLYRAFGHVIFNSPIFVVVTEVISALLDCLSLLSLDERDKDLMYSFLLVLSGIIMDEKDEIFVSSVCISWKEAVSENASIIINRLIGLITFLPMMGSPTQGIIP